MIVAAQLLRDRRRSILWWSLGVVALVLFTVALFPTVSGEEAFDELAEQMPAAMRSMFGMDDAIPLTSAAGYLHGRLFSSLLPLLLLVFGIGTGARVIAGSEQDGTLELVLANPVTRTTVVVERYVAMVALLAALTGVFVVALVALALPFGARDGIPLTGVLGASAGAFGIALLHASVAFAVGAATGRRAWALAAATTLAAGGYLLQGLIAISEAVASVRVVSPWHWYLGRNMLAQGVAPDAIIAPLAVAVVLFGIGTTLFLRRDLR